MSEMFTRNSQGAAQQIRNTDTALKLLKNRLVIGRSHFSLEVLNFGIA